MTETALRVKDLRVAFGPAQVIDGVSLDVGPGELVGLVGESGSGKTTVGRAVLRVLDPGATVSGAVTVGGEDLLGLDAEALRRRRGSSIAMVEQDSTGALNPVLRVGHQVAEVFALHEGLDRRAAERRAVTALRDVRLPDAEKLARRYPHELSGGQRQRVAIAMALAARPKVLVLDEPTTALDATVEAGVLDLLDVLRAQLGTAMLVISHDLTLLRAIAQRVVVLYAGRVVEEGPTADVLRAPRHPYTRALLEAVPRPGTDKRRERVVAIDGLPPSPTLRTDACRFAPRCPMAVDDCRAGEPALATIGPGHTARCIRSTDVPPPRLLIPDASGKAVVGDAGAEPVLDVRDLHAGYGATTVLRGVSATLARGETLGLVGESGSGKTTLAHAVLGLVEPRSGSVLLDGERLAPRLRDRPRDAVRRLQIVPQSSDSSLNPSQTVRTALRRALRRLGDPRDEVELAATVRLDTELLDRRPDRLSGGQRQRVGIARALAGRPTVVVCDEPVSALDVSVQAAVLNLLADLQRDEGLALLFVSHDLDVVRYLADRVMVLYLGETVEVGPTAAVVAGPRHPYTHALLTARDPEAPPLLGEPPSFDERPSGCPFAGRCPVRIGAVCDTEPPPVRVPTPGHEIRCHHEVDVLTEQQAPVAAPAAR